MARILIGMRVIPFFSMVDPVSRLLDRLDKVSGRNSKFIARCPAHDDRGPSLSIGEGDGGSVLVHCFAGCSAEAIMNAVGLELSDLYPPDATIDIRRQERRPRVDYKALCFHLRHEVYVLSIAATKMKDGEKFSDNDWTTLDRVIKSFERLANVG